MSKYVKLYSEFMGFVKNTSITANDKHETRLINLILSHFDEIAEVGTPHGKRAELINSLIQKFGNKMPDSLSLPEEKVASKSFPFISLDSLAVRDFRGFSAPETFKLDKRFTFVFGPNGSGKSSFCEALEYCMLGYINEAISRRIDIQQFIRNSFTGKSEKPILRVRAQEKTGVEIRPDPSLYTFCFIEKNRIEDFARISANTPNEKQNLLAALFGLREFNDFVGNFTKNITDKIDVLGKNKIELDKKAAVLNVQIENINKAKVSLKTLQEKKDALCSENGYAFPFEQIEKFIQGESGNAGRLSVVNDLLSKPLSPEITVQDSVEIEKLIEELEKSIDSCAMIKADFDKMKDKVVFKDLYKAVLAVEEYTKDKCPVCETPVGETIKNPYTNSREKLETLQSIVEMEEKLLLLLDDLQKQMLKIREIIHDRAEIAKVHGGILSPIELKITAIDGFSSIPLHENAFKTFQDQWKNTISQNTQLDKLILKFNSAIRVQKEQRSILEKERNKLQLLSTTITKLNTENETVENNIVVWEKEVEQFQTENAVLIRKAKEENAIIEQNKKYVVAYNRFLSKIEAYRDSLPIRYLKELNNLTVDLYNSFNSHDRPFEMAQSILLPLNVNEPITISFKNEPQVRHDALQVLSEGHIRCLGLAILLAKNIHDGCPVIIFDDVVNAIDDDHRGGIGKVFFSNSDIAKKQIILTTHNSQFIRELEQNPNKSEYTANVLKMGFYIDPQVRIIRIKLDACENYLVNADNHCITGNWPEALYNCRCSLENISHRLWKHIGNRGYKTDFEVVIRKPKDSPDLMSVVTAVSIALNKMNDQNKYGSIICTLDYLRGLKSASNIAWNYLNMGTHEEESRIEFDGLLVQEITKKINELDSYVKAICKG